MHTKIKNPLRTIIISMAIGVILYISIVIAGDKYAILNAISRLNATIWASILALSLTNYLIRFYRWHLLLKFQGFNVAKLENLTYYIAGFSLTLTPGKVGETVRSVYLIPHGIPISRSVAAFFVERFFDLIAVLVLATFIAMRYEKYYFLVIGTLSIVIIIYYLVNQASLLEKIAIKFAARFGKKMTAFIHHSVSTIHYSSTLIHSKLSLTGVALGLVAWIAEGIALYIILDTLEIHINLSIAIGIYAISLLAGALSFIPGGLGSTEAVMVLLITLMGADLSTATAATIICRISTLWFAIALGIPALMYLELRNK